MGVVLFASLSPRMMAWSLCEECPTFENWQQGNCKLPDKYSLCNPCTNLYIAWSPRVYDLTPCSLCLVRYCTAAWHSCRSKFFPLFFPFVCSCTMLIEAHWVTQEVSRASSAIISSDPEVPECAWSHGQPDRRFLPPYLATSGFKPQSCCLCSWGLPSFSMERRKMGKWEGQWQRHRRTRWKLMEKIWKL